MSVSMYRGQVDRLRKEIADLEKRAADERGRASADRGEALRISNSITRSTSASVAQSKLRQAQAKDASAAAHDKKAADHADKAASRGRQLTSAQNSLDQALATERRRDEAAAKRRREEELRHIRQLEDARRAAASEAFEPVVALRPAREEREKREADPPTDPRWDVCLSYASEDRGYVEMVAGLLKAEKLEVFYDQDEQGDLWGKDLAEHFDRVFRLDSRFCVMFISQAYAAKPWTRHERRSALARALLEEREYLLPARFDDTELPGLRPTIAYLDLRKVAPETLVEHLVKRVRSGK
jgi:hypothetical protein